MSGTPPRSSHVVPAEDLPRLAYLVCATRSSGSSLLCEALTASGVAGEPGEVFSAPHLRTIGARWGSPDFGSYLARLLQTATTPEGVFGATVLPDDFARLLAGLRTLPALAKLTNSALLGNALPSLRCVHVSRRDRLRHAVSLELAMQAGTGDHQPLPAAFPSPRPRFDRAAIEQTIHDLEQYEARWRRFFRSAGVEPIEVVYEDLAADPASAARAVLDQLGIDGPNDELACPTPPPADQADALTEEWAERFLRGAGRP